MKTINEELKRVMKSHDIRQQELAKILNVSPSTIAAWLNGSVTPSSHVVQRIYYKIGACLICGADDGHALSYQDDKISLDIKLRIKDDTNKNKKVLTRVRQEKDKVEKNKLKLSKNNITINDIGDIDDIVKEL